MNKARLIWGIVCLILAIVIAILAFALPLDSIYFYAGEANFRWVPAVVLGITGVVLLITAFQVSNPESTPVAQPFAVIDPEKAALNKRLEIYSWGLFLIMLGGSMFLPKTFLPKGMWSIGVGLIMLGLNAARYYYKIKMSGFTIVLGILAIIGGIVELMGVGDIEGSVLIIVLGAYLILKPWFEKRQKSGKTEDK
jgi:hypothetical protein